MIAILPLRKNSNSLIRKNIKKIKNQLLHYKLNNSFTTQTLNSLFQDNSGFYIFNKRSFKKKN